MLPGFIKEFVRAKLLNHNSGKLPDPACRRLQVPASGRNGAPGPIAEVIMIKSTPSLLHVTVNQPDGSVWLGTRSDAAPAPADTSFHAVPAAAPSLRSRTNFALAGLQSRIAQRVPSRATVVRSLGNAMTVGGSGLAVHGVASAIGMAPMLMTPVTDRMTADEAHVEVSLAAFVLGAGEVVVGGTIAMIGSMIASDPEGLLSEGGLVPDSPVSTASMASNSPASTPRLHEIEMLEITHQLPSTPLRGDDLV